MTTWRRQRNLIDIKGGAEAKIVAAKGRTSSAAAAVAKTSSGDGGIIGIESTRIADEMTKENISAAAIISKIKHGALIEGIIGGGVAAASCAA